MIQILQNSQSENYKLLKKNILGRYFPWFYYDRITKTYEDTTKHFYFAHNFIINDKINSEFFVPLIVPLISRLKHTKILRVKANLYTKVAIPTLAITGKVLPKN